MHIFFLKKKTQTSRGLVVAWKWIDWMAFLYTYESALHERGAHLSKTHFCASKGINGTDNDGFGVSGPRRKQFFFTSLGVFFFISFSFFVYRRWKGDSEPTTTHRTE